MTKTISDIVLKNEITNSIKEHFGNYLLVIRSLRSNYIKQNNFFASSTRNEAHSEKKNKIYRAQRKRKKKNSISIQKICHAFSQNFFCFPISDNMIVPTSYTLNYIDVYPSFSSFDKTMSKSFSQIQNFFHFYPKTLEPSELIENRFFFIFVFIDVVKKIKKLNPSFNCNDEENILYVVSQLGETIGKKLQYLYRIISWYTCAVSNTLKKNNISKNPESISQYRKTFCPICFEYLCRQHFYLAKEEEEMRGIKFIKSFIKKTSGNKTFFVKKEDYDDREKTEVCPISTYKKYNNSCKHNVDVKIIKQNGIEENHIEIFKSISKDDFYILNAMVSTKMFKNSCFFARMFNYKYTCATLQKILMICTDEKNLFEIDGYLSYGKMGGKVLPKLSLEKMEIEALPNVGAKASGKSKKKSSNFFRSSICDSGMDSKKRMNYTPCNHSGKCDEKCFCISNRGYCEKFCFCNELNCEFMFKGCSCTSGCKYESSSSNRSKCKCIKEERECDPDICKNCKNCLTCNNMKIYYKMFKKTSVSESILIPAAGLFAMEDIYPNELIDEYVGELVEKEELEKRSAVNMAFEINYGFELTELFDVDAARCGNNLRYVNHSSFGYDNAYAREKFVRGIIKIALYAKRYIKTGEEIYFDYHMKNSSWIAKYNKLYDPGSK